MSIKCENCGYERPPKTKQIGTICPVCERPYPENIKPTKSAFFKRLPLYISIPVMSVLAVPLIYLSYELYRMYFPNHKTIASECLDFHRSELNDPLSAYLVDWNTSGESAIHVNARAKNGFGAFIPITFHCVYRGGRIDKVNSKQFHKLKEQLGGFKN